MLLITADHCSSLLIHSPLKVKKLISGSLSLFMTRRVPSEAPWVAVVHDIGTPEGEKEITKSHMLLRRLTVRKIKHHTDSWKKHSLDEAQWSAVVIDYQTARSPSHRLTNGVQPSEGEGGLSTAEVDV